jgi:hypothetical protein
MGAGYDWLSGDSRRISCNLKLIARCNYRKAQFKNSRSPSRRSPRVTGSHRAGVLRTAYNQNHSANIDTQIVPEVADALAR